MKKETYRLPTEEITSSVRRYVKAFRKLMSPISKVWPDRSLSYDPGVLIGSISLTNREAIALYEALTGKEYEI